MTEIKEYVSDGDGDGGRGRDGEREINHSRP